MPGIGLITNPRSRQNTVAREVIIESDGSHGYTIDGDAFDGEPCLRIGCGPTVRIIAM
jgi:hypothetical protein